MSTIIKLTTAPTTESNVFLVNPVYTLLENDDYLSKLKQRFSRRFPELKDIINDKEALYKINLYFFDDVYNLTGLYIGHHDYRSYLKIDIEYIDHTDKVLKRYMWIKLYDYMLYNKHKIMVRAL